MILIDSSVWVDHLRLGDQGLAALLREGAVATHALIIEELACGQLSQRLEILGYLEALPKLPQAAHSELLEFLAANRLYGTGLGAVDAHLLASARLGRAQLWTRDKQLRMAAERLGLAWE